MFKVGCFFELFELVSLSVPDHLLEFMAIRLGGQGVENTPIGGTLLCFPDYVLAIRWHVP
jgi:hypothetical protein